MDLVSYYYYSSYYFVSVWFFIMTLLGHYLVIDIGTTVPQRAEILLQIL